MADTFIAKQQHKAGRGSEKAGGKLKFARSVSHAQSVTSTTTGGAHERGSQQICGGFYCPVMQVTISNHIYWLRTRRTAYRQGAKIACSWITLQKNSLFQIDSLWVHLVGCGHHNTRLSMVRTVSTSASTVGTVRTNPNTSSTINNAVSIRASTISASDSAVT